MKKSNTIQYIKVFLLSIIICTGVGFTFAQLSPARPGSFSLDNNIAGPINTSDVTQVKGNADSLSGVTPLPLLHIGGKVLVNKLLVTDDSVLPQMKILSLKRDVENKLCVNPSGKFIICPDVVSLTCNTMIPGDQYGTITSSIGGLNCTNSNGGNVVKKISIEKGSNVTFSAIPVSGWRFVKWQIIPNTSYCHNKTTSICSIQKINESYTSIRAIFVPQSQ